MVVVGTGFESVDGVVCCVPFMSLEVCISGIMCCFKGVFEKGRAGVQGKEPERICVRKVCGRFYPMAGRCYTHRWHGSETTIRRARDAAGVPQQ